MNTRLKTTIQVIAVTALTAWAVSAHAGTAIGQLHSVAIAPGRTVALNPQPIPPGRATQVALNPQPIPPGREGGSPGDSPRKSKHSMSKRAR